jgi:hypothetical protein
MALCGPPAVPEQAERGVQRQPPPALLPTTASLQGQTLDLSFAQALLLTIMGQLSERFVVQHCSPSLPCGFE